MLNNFNKDPDNGTEFVVGVKLDRTVTAGGRDLRNLSELEKPYETL